MGGRKQKLFGRQVRGYTCFRNIQGVKHIGCRPFKFINAEKLEAAVWETVNTWLEDPEALVKTAINEGPRANTLRTELDQTEKGLTQVARGRESLLTLVAEGRIELTDAVRTKLDDLTHRENQLLLRKREIEIALSSQTTSHKKVTVFLRAAREVVQNLDALDFDAKRALTRQLVCSVVVSGRPREGLRVTIHTTLPGVIIDALSNTSRLSVTKAYSLSE
jgi:hypothetical protein